MVNINDLETGLVVNMSPGYYTTDPYYVRIDSVDEGCVVTSIPGHRTVEMSKDDGGLDYHLKRMEIVGPESKYRHLLLNQSLK